MNMRKVFSGQGWRSSSYACKRLS